MKTHHVIPPAVALGLIGAWNFFQVREISSLETEEALLRRKIEIAGSYQGGMAAILAGRKSPLETTDRIDWQELSEAMRDSELNNGFGNLRDTLTLQRRLLAMSRDELVTALDEIAALNLTDDAREALEAMIVDPLVKKDPRFALEKFANRIGSGMLGWQLSGALRDWAKKDLKGAAAWFDKQIAAGAFDSKSLDGKSVARMQFEAALLGPLLGSDYAAAGRRINSLPAEQRREVLEQLTFRDLGAVEQKAYANLVRQYVPGEERAASFAHIATALVNDRGYDKVGDFLDAVKATPEERAATASQAAASRFEVLGRQGELGVAKVDELRGWLIYQAKGDIDAITGRALAVAVQAGGKFDYPDGAELVLHYNKQAKNDEVLVSFLQASDANTNLEKARELAEMVADPVRREEILAAMK